MKMNRRTFFAAAGATAVVANIPQPVMAEVVPDRYDIVVAKYNDLIAIFNQEKATLVQDSSFIIRQKILETPTIMGQLNDLIRETMAQFPLNGTFTKDYSSAIYTDDQGNEHTGVMCLHGTKNNEDRYNTNYIQNEENYGINRETLQKLPPHEVPVLIMKHLLTKDELPIDKKHVPAFEDFTTMLKPLVLNMSGPYSAKQNITEIA